MSERMTTIEEHADTVRDFVLEQDEPSDFALDALARIEKEAAQKDAVIKALADALAGASSYGRADDGLPCYCSCREGPHLTTCEAARAALRLAGRLP